MNPSSPPPPPSPPETGALVMVRLGGQQRLHVARVEGVTGSVVTVRKFLVSALGNDALPGAWTKHPVRLPLSMVEPANPDDPRVLAASVAHSAREARRPPPTRKAKKKTKRSTRGAKTTATSLPEST